MLKKYTQRAIDILACEIHKDGKIEKLLDEKKKEVKGEYVYTHRGRSAITTRLIFSVDPKQEPQAGDFIVHANKDDIYCCPKDVFDKKYLVAGMSIM